MKRYCITDSLDVAARAARDGVDMIQIRAKDLCARALAEMVRGALANALQSKVLVNARTDIALACGAHGVHLPADSITPATIRRIAPAGFMIGVSCHTIEELCAAEREGADFAVYGPVFPSVTKSLTPIGIDAFREAVAAVGLPVYALGGVTTANAQTCIDAGATGIAGISLFT
ncbi:MAG TPA: thiamine phosphate synthase [Bryobacteraceae bacterium]|nr:thiamine phosphate synthase [Bryobacteraceae bacterium]